METSNNCFFRVALWLKNVNLQYVNLAFALCASKKQIIRSSFYRFDFCYRSLNSANPLRSGWFDSS
jgi:hypothetical protein